MTPLTPDEIEMLLHLLTRLMTTSTVQSIRRVSKSLFTLMTRQKYEADIKF